MERHQKVLFAKMLKLDNKLKKLGKSKEGNVILRETQRAALGQLPPRQRAEIKRMASVTRVMLRGVGEHSSMNLMQALGHLFVVRGIGDEIRDT